MDICNDGEYSHIRLYDLVIVSDYADGRNAQPHPLQFAGVDELGRPMTWNTGDCSYPDAARRVWQYCRLAEVD